MITVWTYSTGLEKGSGRFSQPGDYFTYIMFIGTIILVCHFYISKKSTLFPYVDVALLSLFRITKETSHICPPSHHLAEAVPKDEEDYPRISRGPIIRNQT